MEKADISSMTVNQLRDWFVHLGHKPFRAVQVFKWMHARGVRSFDEMTDLSKTLRAQLTEQAPLVPVEILDELTSFDGTKKFLVAVGCGDRIEAVWMPSEKRRTLCVSTQVGCAMRCAFCATGTLGLKRSLSAGEIVGQVEAVVRRLKTGQLIRPVTNVVFMGMGEPLANLEATVSAVDILLDDTGMGMSRRHITVSTIGLVPAMKKFVERSRVKLAVSLNATTDEIRESLMPVNRRFPLKVLLKTCKDLALHGADRITFEYVMLSGVNDSLDDARSLVKLLGGISCKVNLIPYNSFEPLGFSRPSDKHVLEFLDVLTSKGLSAFVRHSRGEDQMAACGQLLAADRR